MEATVWPVGEDGRWHKCLRRSLQSERRVWTGGVALIKTFDEDCNDDETSMTYDEHDL